MGLTGVVDVVVAAVGVLLFLFTNVPSAALNVGNVGGTSSVVFLLIYNYIKLLENKRKSFFCVNKLKLLAISRAQSCNLAGFNCK
jgi:hypothetical protein